MSSTFTGSQFSNRLHDVGLIRCTVEWVILFDIKGDATLSQDSFDIHINCGRRCKPDRITEGIKCAFIRFINTCG